MRKFLGWFIIIFMSLFLGSIISYFTRLLWAGPLILGVPTLVILVLLFAFLLIDG